ncbi:MAG: hypothetical protein KDI15_03380 [Thiothrix sp.]|nr:hypothetical protein [Thiothrix sp.]HPE59375.1 hypothetical protein [Thiolinea sp.]
MNDTGQRLSIWTAKSQLTYEKPLEPGDPLFVDTAPARGDFNLKNLYRQLNVDNQGVLHTPSRKQYILFTGHRGCGKSTELLRVAKYLNDPGRYYVIHLDCLTKLDINNLRYSDVLLAVAAALLERMEHEDRITVESVFLDKINNWFKERVITHARLKNLEIELKAGARVEAGLPWLAKLFGEMTNKIGTGSTYREELREVVRNSFSELAGSFNQFIRAAEDKISQRNLGQRILFTVDGTDRLNAEDAHKFFVEDVHQLTQLESLFIYCAPIHLLHADNQLNASFNLTFRVPMLKIRDRDNQPLAAHYAIMRELAWKRVPSYLFETPETLDLLICYSGGHPRDLLRLLNVAINHADDELINYRAAEKAVQDVANDYRRLVDSKDYTQLVWIDQHPDIAPDEVNNEKTVRMLYNLILLEYNNYFWKSHPVITTLQGYRKALQDSAD